MPYKTFNKDSLKIGVFGIGIELQGLVADHLYENIGYINPIISANKISNILRSKEKCDFVICLSHLGDKYVDNKVSDEVLAMQTDDIDLIIGGHTHRFFPEPRKYINKSGKEVIVNQVGWAGFNWDDWITL